MRPVKRFSALAASPQLFTSQPQDLGVEEKFGLLGRVAAWTCRCQEVQFFVAKDPKGPNPPPTCRILQVFRLQWA